ncbi:myosin-7 [Anaeramoeba flamelloides]|uniref:Myosin-7 n=1 Tax=Anaeramoeba flamelloides TaxID=1746091 RepID=A0ABQ8XH10_9EUKA|nr:myosin-7 [Anaeramoeba flamelloides]
MNTTKHKLTSQFNIGKSHNFHLDKKQRATRPDQYNKPKQYFYTSTRSFDSKKVQLKKERTDGIFSVEETKRSKPKKKQRIMYSPSLSNLKEIQQEKKRLVLKKQIKRKLDHLVKIFKQELKEKQMFVDQINRVTLIDQIATGFSSLLPQLFVRKDYQLYHDSIPRASGVIFRILRRVPEQTTHEILIKIYLNFLEILVAQDTCDLETISFNLINLSFSLAAFQKIQITGINYHPISSFLKRLINEEIQKLTSEHCEKALDTIKKLFSENKNEKNSILGFETYKDTNSGTDTETDTGDNIDTNTKSKKEKEQDKKPQSMQSIIKNFKKLNNLLRSHNLQKVIIQNIFLKIIQKIVFYVMNSLFLLEKMTLSFAFQIKSEITILNNWFKKKNYHLICEQFIPIFHAANVIIMKSKLINKIENIITLSKDICPTLSITQVWKILKNFKIDDYDQKKISSKKFSLFKQTIKQSNQKIVNPHFSFKNDLVLNIKQIKIENWKSIQIPKIILQMDDFFWIPRLLNENSLN